MIEETIDGMTMVAGVKAMQSGDFATLEELEEKENE